MVLVPGLEFRERGWLSEALRCCAQRRRGSAKCRACLGRSRWCTGSWALRVRRERVLVRMRTGS